MSDACRFAFTRSDFSFVTKDNEAIEVALEDLRDELEYHKLRVEQTERLIYILTDVLERDGVQKTGRSAVDADALTWRNKPFTCLEQMPYDDDDEVLQ